MTSRAAVRSILQEHPLISRNGYERSRPGQASLLFDADNRVLEDAFNRERSDLLKKIESFELLTAWMQHIKKSDEPNKSVDSRFLSIFMEAEIGSRCSHGIFIVAALHMGFSVEHAGHDTSVYVNFLASSLSEKLKNNRSFMTKIVHDHRGPDHPQRRTTPAS